MPRLDPLTGEFWLDDVPAPLRPWMPYAEFMAHPLAAESPLLSGSAANQRRHQLPTQSFEGTPFDGVAEWIDGGLNALWFQPRPERNPDPARRFTRGDERIQALQERWVASWGVALQRYAWGLVWPRFNIHADYHDVAVIFAKESEARRPIWR